MKREFGAKIQDLESQIDKLNKEIDAQKKLAVKLNKQLEEATSKVSIIIYMMRVVFYLCMMTTKIKIKIHT